MECFGGLRRCEARHGLVIVLPHDLYSGRVIVGVGGPRAQRPGQQADVVAFLAMSDPLKLRLPSIWKVLGLGVSRADIRGALSQLSDRPG